MTTKTKAPPAAALVGAVTAKWVAAALTLIGLLVPATKKLPASVAQAHRLTSRVRSRGALEHSHTVRQRRVGWQRRPGVSARKVDGAGVGGRNRAVLIEGDDREIERTARARAAGRHHGKMGGADDVDADTVSTPGSFAALVTGGLRRQLPVDGVHAEVVTPLPAGALVAAKLIGAAPRLGGWR